MTEKFELLAARSRRRQGSLGVTRRFAATRLLQPRARAGGTLPALAAVLQRDGKLQKSRCRLVWKNW